MAAWIWVLIPITAILAGTIKEWFKFKSKQDRLGHSTHELEETVQTLRETLEASEAERRRLTERVQNLETIVTSQAWDALHEAPGSADMLSDGRPQATDDAVSDHQETDGAAKAERLARRMNV